MNIPKCVDCKWYRQTSKIPLALRPPAWCVFGISLVGDGIEGGSGNMDLCWRRRENECGIDARFFEATDSEPTPEPPPVLATPKDKLLGEPEPDESDRKLREKVDLMLAASKELGDTDILRSMLLGEPAPIKDVPPAGVKDEPSKEENPDNARDALLGKGKG